MPNRDSERPDSNKKDPAQDLAGIFNYPAIGELFKGSDTKDLDNFASRLGTVRQDLERIIRNGSRTEADGAERAIRSIEVTLEFLQSLQNLRLNEK